MKITLQQLVGLAIAEHGGLQNAAKATGIDVGYLSRLHTGNKTNPSVNTIKRLGAREIRLYEIKREKA